MWLISSWALLFSAAWLERCQGCFTTGNEENVPCVFPFSFQETTYFGCTKVEDPEGKQDPAGQGWCATSVDEHGVYIEEGGQFGYCMTDCPDGDADTLDTRTVNDAIEEKDRRCGKDQTCKHQARCPQFLQQKENLNTLQKRKRSRQYRELLKKIKTSVCNKSKRGVCCPTQRKVENNDEKCKNGDSCLIENQCKYAQDLRRRFKNGDNVAKQELIGLICNRKERKFCCPNNTTPPSFQDASSASWLPRKGECGLNPDLKPERVLGGVSTTPGMFPFTALMGYTFTERKWVQRIRDFQDITSIKYKCGGTLINLWYVVTAAHCHGSSKITSVRLGEWDVGRNPDRPNLVTYQDFYITRDQVIVHPNYKPLPTNTENDVAIVKLPRPAILNSVVQIVCLPIHPAEAATELNIPNISEGLLGTRPNVVGWGYTEYDPWRSEQQGDFDKTNVASSVQQRLAVPVLSTSECSRKFATIKFTPDDSQICAGGEEGKDSCKGDSGGPLYLSKVLASKESTLDGTEPWYLMGIVSFGSRTCGNCRPGVYSRVESFIPWIKKTIGNV